MARTPDELYTDNAIIPDDDTRFVTMDAATAGASVFAGIKRGLSARNAVLVASTGNLTLSGEQTIDGVLTSASRVLVKDQSTATQDGIYVTAAGAWARSADLPAGDSASGICVPVQRGTTYAGKIMVCTNTPGSDVVGTHGLTFPDDCCVSIAAMAAYSPANYTETASTPVGHIEGIDNALAKVAPVTVSVANEYKITENGATISFVAAGATPALRPEAAATIDNGELALPWLTVRAANVEAVSGGAVQLLLTEGLIQYAANKPLSLEQATPAAGVVASTFTTAGGTGGAANGATAPAGGAAVHRGGTGGAGDATYAAGAGAPITAQGGAAGANGGAGGAAGGNVVLDVGAGSGAGANGSIHIGTGTPPVAITLGGASTLVDVQGYLRLAEQSAPAAAANKGSLYVFDDGGDTEFCYADDDGNDVQLTRDGKPNTNCGVRALGTSTFSINGADDGVSCEWTGTSTGVAGTIDQGRAGQVTPITLTGTAGTITFAAGSGVTLEATRGKTLTTNAPAASTVVHVVVMYHSATFASIGGDCA